jgi:hypothetical protein
MTHQRSTISAGLDSGRLALEEPPSLDNWLFRPSAMQKRLRPTFIFSQTLRFLLTESWDLVAGKNSGHYRLA